MIDTTPAHGVRIPNQEVAKAYFSDTSVKARQKRKDDRKAVATGVGTTAMGVGLIGGGIPGAKPKSKAIWGPESSKIRDMPKNVIQGGKGGIFGFRENAHKLLLEGYEHGKKVNTHDTDVAGHFLRGAGNGAIESEKKVIGHMKRGKKISNRALIGGAALTAYGATRKPGLVPRNDQVKKANRIKFETDDPRRNAIAMTAGGAAGTAGALGAGQVLAHQNRAWSRRAVESYKRAGQVTPDQIPHQKGQPKPHQPKAAPELGEHTVSRKGGLHRVEPKMSGKDFIERGQHHVAHWSKEKIEEVGMHRGAAQKQRYFARLYGTHAKLANRYVAPGAALVGAVGAKNLYSQRKKKPVGKSLVELREVEKSYFSAANRAARVAARRSAREARQQARGGALIQRKVAEPVAAALDRSVDRAGEKFKESANQAANQAVSNFERRAPRIGLKTGVAAGVGLGGGATLGELGRQEVKRQYDKRSVRKDDIPAGYYPYLLPTIREEIAGIPATRRNPISPLQQLAGARLMADGTRKIRSHNPFFRTSRTREGMRQLVMGQQMVNRGAGEPL